MGISTRWVSLLGALALTLFGVPLVGGIGPATATDAGGTSVGLPGSPDVVIAAGISHVCGIRSDGTVGCSGQSPPEGTFSGLAAGATHTCGLRTDGTVACWGDNSFGQASPPAGIFRDLAAGGFGTCGLSADGTISCWGSVPGTVPAGRYIDVAVGGNDPCGLKTDGTVICGSGPDPQLPGRYLELSSSNTDVCGLTTGGDLSCKVRGFVPGAWLQADPATNQVCGVGRDGTAVCEGVGALSPAGGEFLALTMGGFPAIVPGAGEFACGVRPSGEMECFGPSPPPPPGSFRRVSVAVSDGAACGLRPDGTAVCWNGENSADLGPVSPGAFVAVGVGVDFACGLRAERTITCWGPATQLNGTVPAGDGFRSLHVGLYAACGLGMDGAMTCSDGTTVPMQLRDLDLGRSVSCGIGAEGLLTCFLMESAPTSGAQTLNPPAGAFAEVAVGPQSACATNEAGALECWGYLNFSITSHPAVGPGVTSFSLNYADICAATVGGAASCTGMSFFPGPPNGTTAIAGTFNTMCGVQAHGRLVCWNQYEPFGFQPEGSGPWFAVGPGPATAGQAYAFRFEAQAQPPVTRYQITAGALPAGFTLNEATGEITGSSTTAGITGGITVNATNDLFDDASRTFDFEVIPAAIASLRIDPAATSIAAGEPVAYEVEGFDAYGNSLGSRTGAATFSVTPSGSCTGPVCTGLQAGPHTVRAVVDALEATATLDVVPGPPAAVSVSPEAVTVEPGVPTTFTAEAFDAHGNSRGDATAGAAWSIAPTGTCSGSTCTPAQGGPHRVRAALGDVAGEAALTVTVPVAPPEPPAPPTEGGDLPADVPATPAAPAPGADGQPGADAAGLPGATAVGGTAAVPASPEAGTLPRTGAAAAPLVAIALAVLAAGSSLRRRSAASAKPGQSRLDT